MAHRYQTRSTTPTSLINFTQELPRIQTHRRHSRRHSSVTITNSDLPSERITDEEMIVELLGDSDQDGQQIDTGSTATILPCINNSYSEIPELITCSICFDAITASCEPMATRCGHIFCSGCLSLSLKKWKRCPTCQATAKFSTSIRLYF